MYLTALGEKAMHWFGYGEPKNSNLWIMGYDEGKEWKEFDGKSLSEHITLEDLKKIPGTYNGYFRLITSVFPRLVPNENYFITNLFPFGRCNTNIDSNKEQKSIFWKENLHSDELYEKIKKYRFDYLKKQFEKYDWKSKNIVFSIGIGYLRKKEIHLIEFLQYLLDSNCKCLNEYFKKDDLTNYLYYDSNCKIFVTYHASRKRFFSDLLLSRLKTINENSNFAFNS